MGGDNFHNLNQINVIQKAIEPKLSYKARYSTDRYGNEYDVTVFHAKNVKSIEFISNKVLHRNMNIIFW